MTKSDLGSPPKKKLKLTHKAKNENVDIEYNMPSSNGVNTDSTTSELETPKNTFMKTCLQVSFEAYKDFKKRFQLLHLLECFNNKCVHTDQNATIKEIPQRANQSITIEMKNNTWNEALEVCLMCITPDQYLSANVLKDIVEIILNIHEDSYSEYTTDYLLRKCQNTLLLQFEMHPPCRRKDVRDCYKKFLTSPMDRKDNSLSNRKDFCSDEGIVSYCLSRLAHDISAKSSEGTLIKKQELPTEIDGPKQQHWKKENLELFELLLRNDRIERCMLVLESVVYLLQIDLGLWHARHLGTDRQKKSQIPLLFYLLWQDNLLLRGAVTWQCVKIMTLFAYYIHLEYPERHIKTMSLWMNIMMQGFYMNEKSAGIDYPNRGVHCVTFAKEFYKITLGLPWSSISRILENLQPFMQYLLGIHYIQKTLNFTQNDILNIVIWCVKDKSWDNYCTENKNPIVLKKSTLKPHKLFDHLTEICESFIGSINIPKDSYRKLELKKKESHSQKDYFLNLLFKTLVAFLEAHNLNNFYQVLEYYKKSKNNDPISHSSYFVSDQFIKKYRSIVQNIQELFKIFEERKDEESVKILSDLINFYFS